MNLPRGGLQEDCGGKVHSPGSIITGPTVGVKQTLHLFRPGLMVIMAITRKTRRAKQVSLVLRPYVELNDEVLAA